MNKRYAKLINSYVYRNQPVKMTFGSITVAALCLLILIVSTFTQLHLAHFWFISPDCPKGIITFSYIPQIPAVLLSASLIGPVLALLVMIIYVIIGLFVWPVFALGGGWNYILNFNFGYILGFFPAVILVGKILDKQPNAIGIVKADVAGVCAIHFVGILYTIIIGIITHTSWENISSWIYHISLIRLHYDLAIGAAILFLSRYLKSFLWIAMERVSHIRKKST